MSENENRAIAVGAYAAARNLPWDVIDRDGEDRAGVDAVLAVIGPELDRLRAEVERQRDLCSNRHIDQSAQSLVNLSLRTESAEAERDVLRAVVAKVKALADEWETRLVDYLCQGCASPNGISTSPFADDLRAVLASVPEPSEPECGGCRGIGSHRRWCPAKAGPRTSTLGRLSERAEDLADSIGANHPAAANACYRVASLLRADEPEPSASEPAANPRGDDRETASESAADGGAGGQRDGAPGCNTARANGALGCNVQHEGDSAVGQQTVGER